jgi:hypothetical protein
VTRLAALVALVFCFVAGYFLAGLWSSARDTSPLAQICARVDYVNSLQENLKGQDAASEEVRAELKALADQCRTALGRSIRRSSVSLQFVKVDVRQCALSCVATPWADRPQDKLLMALKHAAVFPLYDERVS